MNHRTIGAIAALTLAIANTATAQDILNGDFEDHETGDCALNLDDAEFNTIMQHCTSFGQPHGEICVMVGEDGCGWGLPPFSGTTKLGLSSQPNGTYDAMSMALSQPLVDGDRYEIRFAIHTVIEDFSPDHGGLDIGVSDDPTDFGSSVLLVGAHDEAWTIYRTQFTAPHDASFITLRQANAGVADAWVHIDGFELRPCQGPCAPDLDGDFDVDADDLIAVLSAWGVSHAGDVNCDGTTNVDDLIEVLTKWGSCE